MIEEFFNIPQEDSYQRDHMIRSYVYPFKNRVAEAGIQVFASSLETYKSIDEFHEQGSWNKVEYLR